MNKLSGEAPPKTGVEPAKITVGFVRMMSAYNSEMNRRIYGAAAQLADDQRKRDVGLYFKSLHGTLNHLLWADRQWMSRFDGWPPNTLPIRDSPMLFADFAELSEERVKADARIEEFSARIDDRWLAEDLVWFSGVAGREMRRKRDGLVVHFFNHQTHHRGQAHSALTIHGVDSGDTDLPLIVNER